jgi:hypothetical protein
VSIAVNQNNQIRQKIQKKGTVVSNLDFTSLYWSNTFSNKPFSYDRRRTIFPDGVVFQHAVKTICVTMQEHRFQNLNRNFIEKIKTDTKLITGTQ